jgi:hypothetical protein
MPLNTGLNNPFSNISNFIIPNENSTAGKSSFLILVSTSRINFTPRVQALTDLNNINLLQNDNKKSIIDQMKGNHKFYYRHARGK